MMLLKKSKLKQKLKFDAIGTSWTIDIFDSLKDVKNQVVARIDDFDRSYSRFRADSLVTKMSKSAGEYILPPDAPPLLNLYRDLYFETGGLVTPLIGNVLADAGYDSTYSLKDKRLQTPSPWEDVLHWNLPRLTIKKPVLLDFGAAGKGYLIDIIGNLLRKNGINSFSIDAGGDILVSDTKTTVGLENPNNTKQVIGLMEIDNSSICGSSGNRRNWGKFHHIINPRTLKSTEEVLAVWVTAQTALIADAISTCLFFVSPESLARYNFDYLILYPNFRVKRSKNFKGQLYEAN